MKACMVCLLAIGALFFSEPGFAFQAATESSSKGSNEDCDLLDRDVIEALAKKCVLSEAQVHALNYMVDAYLQEVRDCRSTTQDRLNKGAQTLNDSLLGVRRREVTLEDHNKLVEELSPKLDALRVQLHSEIDEILRRTISKMVTDIGLDDSAARTLWRLVCRKFYFRMSDGRDFHCWIDLSVLASEASEEGEELNILVTAEPESALWPAREALLAILEQYEERLQAHVEAFMAEQRKPHRGPAVQVFTSVDDPGWNMSQKELAKTWRRAHAVVAGPHAQISDLLAASVGVDAQQRWDDRLLKEMCPEIMGDFFPDQLAQWIRRHVMTDANVPNRQPILEQVETVVAEYRKMKAPLQREAALAGIAAHADGWLGVADTAASRRYARALISLHMLSINAVKRVISVLPDQSRIEMLRLLTTERIRTGPTVPPYLPTVSGHQAEFASISKPFG